MGPLLIALFVLLGGLLLVGLWLMGLYNGLVRLRQAVKNAFANIDVQLKRRHDLIPNLVNTVKGYASHEKDTLERVVNARARATGATTTTDKLRAEGAADQAEAQVEDLAGAVTDKASELTDQAAEKATGYWNEIKQAFDEGKKGE